MRRPKTVLALLAALALIGGAGFVLTWRESSPPIVPGIAFIGTEPGHIEAQEGFQNWAAGISVTNRDAHNLAVSFIQVEVSSNGLWLPVFTGPAEVSPVLEPGESVTNKYSPLLAGGEHRKYIVPWPRQRPWRMRVHYGWELKGPRAFLTKLRVAWRLRSLSPARVGGITFGENHEIVREEISR